MASINRSALILRPNRPFLDWLNKLPFTEGEKRYTLQDVRDDPTVYLIPDFDTAREKEEWVFDNFETFFDEQMTAWWTGKRKWPTSRTVAMFKDWFDIEILSIVDDAMDDDIEEYEVGIGWEAASEDEHSAPESLKK